MLLPMMQARSRLVPINAHGIYHCVSRCVRRAWLCARDPFTGADHEHRRRWVEVRLAQLADPYAVDITGRQWHPTKRGRITGQPPFSASGDGYLPVDRPSTRGQAGARILSCHRQRGRALIDKAAEIGQRWLRGLGVALSRSDR